MASFMFNAGKGLIWDWVSPETPGVWRFLLIETATLVEATVQDSATITALAPDEPDDASYARKTLTTSRTINNTSNQYEHEATQVTWTALAGGETIFGGVVYIDEAGTDTDATNIPVAYVELSSSVISNGGDFTFRFKAASPGIVFYGA